MAAIPLAPVLFMQGRRLRRETPKLPDAALPWAGEVPGPDPIRLLVLGDSTAAGVGVETQVDGLVGCLAAELAGRSARGVTWEAIGENGATARDLVHRYLAPALEESWDIVFLSIGGNDALALRSRAAFGRDIRTLLNALRDRNPNAVVIMSSLPAFFRFTLLPEPLRSSLYRHSQGLENAARAIVATMPGVTMSAPPPPYNEGFFASDSFHPSAAGYLDWARFAIDDATADGTLDFAPTNSRAKRP